MLKGGREMYFRKKEFIQVADGLQKQIFALKKELNSLHAGQLVCRERKGKIRRRSVLLNLSLRPIRHQKEQWFVNHTKLPCPSLFSSILKHTPWTASNLPDSESFYYFFVTVQCLRRFLRKFSSLFSSSLFWTHWRFFQFTAGKF